ncbi:MAG: hypothetical protein IH849_05030 [Acidobacteria bacterium]|nr:hypothetical protein [Acidobacteriota bacterium]
MLAHRHPSITTANRVMAVVGTLALSLSVVAKAEAATPTLTGLARMAAPLIAHLETGQSPQQEQEAARRDPPPVIDPASGPVFSVFGGSVFSGSSAFQTGATLAYFFGPKANIGVEAEGNLTIGPGGRVAQFMGSLVMQAGARTSKFVPYIAVGAGLLRASARFPQEKTDALAELGISLQLTTETAPFFQFGGGLRFYFSPKLAFRVDTRFAQVALDLDGVSFGDSLFAMRRVAGMVSWDF